MNNNESMDKVCKIFNCKKCTLKAWDHKYNSTKSLTRHNRKPISYKVKKKEQVKTSLNMLDANEQLTIK